jgi:hypothetical protein
MEYEYMALAKPTTEIIWFQQILYELGFPQSTPTFIYLDNQNAIALSENLNYHSCSKHVDTQYHFIRRKVLQHEIQF